ncbi:MAG: pyridoxal kinase [Rhizobiaceae bacterium]|nr:pyridoxal kinase [Rhizobiaceae bacterium]
MDNTTKKPAVLVISSHVTRGSVGNRAAVFALEAFGFPVWAVNTILLPWHPGHGPSTRIVPDKKDFDGFLGNIQSAPWIEEIGAVLTGYLANEFQAESIARLIGKLKSSKPELTYLCDPVLGDGDALYLSENTTRSIRDLLVPKCDILTPNLFELGWLVGENTPQSVSEVTRLVSKIGAPAMLVTSVPAETTSDISNLYSDKTGSWRAKHLKYENVPNGVGDLTAATFLARRLSGMTPPQSLQHTTASVLEILSQTASRNSDELTLESDVASLLSPQTNVDVVKLER